MAVRVLVQHRATGEELQPGTRVGDVVISDQSVARHKGLRRYFWLLNYEAQLVWEPFGWHNEWYVDMVQFHYGRQDGQETLLVRDNVIDLVIEGHGPTYRLLDLDELAKSLETTNDLVAAQRALLGTQRFLDAFLHRGAPFPPPAITPFFDSQHQYPPLPT